MHCDEASKKEILNAVKRSGNNNYDSALCQNPTLAGLRHLHSMRGNLVEWFHIRPGAGILEIGAEAGGLTSALLKASRKVTAVEQDRLYADILTTRFRNERDFKLLNMSAKKAITVLKDAQMYFGFVVVNMDSDMLSAYNAEDVRELLASCEELLDSRGELLFIPNMERKSLLKKDFFKKADLYAAEPSVSFPETIRLIAEYPEAPGETFALFTKSKNRYPILIHYDTERKECYSIRTDIENDEMHPGVKRIVHYPFGEEAEKHIADMYRSYLLLAERYCKEEGLTVPDCKKDEDCLIRPFIPSKTLTRLLDERLMEEDLEGFRDLFDRFCEEISYGRRMAISLTNLTFTSIRVAEDGTWLLNDCEWSVEDSMPHEEMLFPAIYEYSKGKSDLRSIVDFGALYAAIGVREEDIGTHALRWEGFKSSIRGERETMAELLRRARTSQENAQKDKPDASSVIRIAEISQQNKEKEKKDESKDSGLFDTARAFYDGVRYRLALGAYKKELHRKCNAYMAYTEKEKAEHTDIQDIELPTVEVIRMDHLKGNFVPGKSGAPIVLFAAPGGKLTADAKKQIALCFERHPSAMLVYADEDVVSEKDGGRRPYFKPDWSPHTLTDFNYIGSIWAVRRSLLPENYWFESSLWQVNNYELLLKLSAPYFNQTPDSRVHDSAVYHLDKVLFCSQKTCLLDDYLHECKVGDGLTEMHAKEYDDMRLRMSRERECPASLTAADGYSHLVYDIPEELPMVSIIIPSKDNPEMLERCILSIREKENYPNLEIVVTDNGSNTRNQGKIEKLATQHDFRYHYEPQEFNFPAICNRAAEIAVGDYLLFMNDDTRVITEGFVRILLGQAMRPEVGAVGAKLLYPDMHTLQHVGIGNFSDRVGFLLNGREDTHVYYMGNNRFVYDVIAVSAACMMVARKKFDYVGGFDEALVASHNDAELCFKLFGLGYYNVVRNDVSVIHHESYSRGSDLRDDMKRKRLDKEKQYLFEKHRDMIGFDPFRSPHLADSPESMVCGYPYDFSVCRHISKISLEDADGQNDGLVITLEDFGLRPGRDEVRITGWQFVPGHDNAAITFSLCLKGKKSCYEIPVERVVRRDVTGLLRGQVHVGLAGFDCRFPRDMIEPGEYEIWGCALGKADRTEIYRNSGISIML